MEHHHHHYHHSHGSTDNIKTAFFLNFGFTIFEIIGGLWTNSVAILSDALHDLGDSFSLGMAWYLDNYSKKGKDRKYSYGYTRFSLLGALINAIILISGSLFMLSVSIPRFMNPERSNAQGMVLFALAGVTVNGIAFLRLKDDRSMNSQMVAWHLLEDVLGWVAVLIVGITLLFVDIPVLDPILSILITLYILYNVIGNLRKTMDLFLQATPQDVDLEKIENTLLAIEGVQSMHDTHVWSLDGDHHVLTTHLVINQDATRENVLCIKRDSKALADEWHLQHITIEVEYEDEDCQMRDEV
ncbi:MAG: cation transporter [Anaerolineaceae bacterium 4572_78]|nr:MAG: cation transporter [Anaerolineaceae bacterium 4572_78]